jgi:cytochrome c peroxidase
MRWTSLKFRGISCGLFLLFLNACSETKPPDDLVDYAENEFFKQNLPAHFPEMKIPQDNPLTKEKVELGKRLFFDPSLSFDGTVSCASCHLPGFAFSDTLAQSKGANGSITERNSPSLMNIGFHPVLMREGAVPSLELQVLSPLEGETEMAHNVVLVCEELNKNSSYVEAFNRVFGTNATPFAVTRALATYERTLVGGDAPYDDFLLGDTQALSAAQKRGLKLFESERLGCVSCHAGPLLTSFAITSNGQDISMTDPGLMRLSLDSADAGKFKVPSLRNIELTAPYMHNGKMKSLDDVVRHYEESPNIKHNPSLKVFKLTDTERQDLLLFFSALTERSLTSAKLNPDN